MYLLFIRARESSVVENIGALLAVGDYVTLKAQIRKGTWRPKTG